MKVLFISQNRQLPELHSDLFKKNGIDVLAWHTLEGLIMFVRQASPNILIIDEGFFSNEQVFIEELRAIKTLIDLPVLFISGSEERCKQIIAYTDIGVHDFIRLPFDEKEFLFKVKILLRLSNTQNVNHESLKLLDQLNSRLTKEHLKFLKIMEMMPLGILIYNEDQMLEFMNHAAELLTGYAFSGLLNSSIEKIHTQLQFQEKFDDVLRLQGDFFCRDTFVNKHKRTIHIERKCLIIEGKDRKQICKVDVLRDITTSLELELLLEARIEERSQGVMATQNITMMALASLAESRDNETGMHLERMRTYSQMIAQDLLDHQIYPEVTAQFVKDIFSSSPLHDIGKVGTPDYVLLKPSKLSNEEWEIMKMHPVIGARTLQDAINQGAHASFLEMARDICYGHHERFDGSGYPLGKRAYEIPLSARIVALADCYDALRSARIYKQAFSHAESKQFIIEKSGIYYDAKVVDAFLRIENKIIETSERFKDIEEKGGLDVSNLHR